MTMPQQGPPKIKGVADIVFCIDTSGSMSPCFEGVKEHVSDFVSGIQSDLQKPMDYRVGLVAAGCLEFQHTDFTDRSEQFASWVSQAELSGGNELTLPAIDMCLDMEWRHGAHKVVVVLTDEPVAGGDQVEFQLSRLDELCAKVEALKVMLFIVAPPCPTYERLGNLDKAIYQELTGQDFEGEDFHELMEQIGKTVSASTPVGGQQQGAVSVTRDLYGIQSGGHGSPNIVVLR